MFNIFFLIKFQDALLTIIKRILPDAYWGKSKSDERMISRENNTVER